MKSSNKTPTSTPSSRSSGPDGRPATAGLNDLTKEEIRSAYADLYQPIITLKEAAEIARCSPTTIKTRMSKKGDFARSAKRGKPVLFFRDRFVEEVMEG